MFGYAVLILVVVEDGLVPIRQVAMGAAAVVLILIVVEDGLVRRLSHSQQKGNLMS